MKGESVSDVPLSDKEMTYRANDEMMASSDVMKRCFLPTELRDRVVIMLLFDQIIREEHVIAAWDQWQEARHNGSTEPLWRMIASLPDLDSDLIHAEAARVYGFYEITVRHHVATRLLRRLREQLSPEVWKRMVELRVLPVDEEERADGYRPKIVFATYDPTRSEIKWLLRKVFPDRYDLGFAPQTVLEGLLEEVRDDYSDRLLAGGARQDDPPFRPACVADDEGLSDQPREQSPNADRNAPMGRPTFIRLFEEALVAAVEQDVEAICLCSNHEGHTEFFFRIDEELTHWRVEEKIPTDVLMAAVKSYILELEGVKAHAVQERVIRRWIEGELVHFRLRWCPATDNFPLQYVIIWVER